MSKYIDADELVKALLILEEMQADSMVQKGVGRAIRHVRMFPAADVRENEYSHKVWCPDGSKDLQCAECRAFVDLEDKYCHECGRILLSEG